MEKVSIIMPCFNDGQYIIESVKSVQNQTYENIELIIVDDGSTDLHTLDVLNNISDNNTVVLHTDRVRPAAARNYGIKCATGRYILPLDSDDLIDPTYVSKAVGIIQHDDSIGVVYCEADLFDRKTGKWDLPKFSLDHMLLDNIVFVTALFRKSDWELIGGFNTNMLHGMEDYDFWLSILGLNKKIIQIPEILFHYRIKQTSRTTSFMSDINIVKDTYTLIYHKHKELYIKHLDTFAVTIRNALIDKTFDNRMLLKSMWVLNLSNKFPRLKKITRQIINRFRGWH